MQICVARANNSSHFLYRPPYTPSDTCCVSITSRNCYKCSITNWWLRKRIATVPWRCEIQYAHSLTSVINFLVDRNVSFFHVSFARQCFPLNGPKSVCTSVTPMHSSKFPIENKFPARIPASSFAEESNTKMIQSNTKMIQSNISTKVKNWCHLQILGIFLLWSINILLSDHILSIEDIGCSVMGAW
jgi:hypothetical protein